MKKIPVTLSVFILTIVPACSDNAPGKKNRTYDIQGSIVHDTKTRTYRMHLPSTYYDNNNQLPLVIGLHGGGGSAEQFEMQSKLSQKADNASFIVVYPDGLPNPNLNVRTWNAGKCCGQNASTLNIDDVGFISKLIDDLATTYRIDKKKVYATGHSNGAMLCYRLADELSAKIAAIAPNAGNLQIKNAYDPARNVPVLQILSKLDKNVKYEGGMTEGPGGQYNPPIDSILDVVAARASCQQTKIIMQSATLFNSYRWTDCNPASFEVQLYLTEDGGHSWPGGNKGSAIGDNPSQAFINNDVIWDFFKAYALP